MTKKDKIIIFDFDGVIVDTFDIAYDIYKSHVPEISADEYLSYFEGNIYDALNITRKRVDNNDFFPLYTDQLLSRDPISGIGDVIKQLTQEYILVIVSSTINEPIDMFLQKHNLLEPFSEILGGDIAERKTEKLEMILEKYKVEPNDCLFITDTLGDLREADKVDIQSIAVTWGYHNAHTLEKGKSYAFARKPQEILTKTKEYFIH